MITELGWIISQDSTIEWWGWEDSSFVVYHCEMKPNWHSCETIPSAGRSQNGSWPSLDHTHSLTHCCKRNFVWSLINKDRGLSNLSREHVIVLYGLVCVFISYSDGGDRKNSHKDYPMNWSLMMQNYETLTSDSVQIVFEGAVEWKWKLATPCWIFSLFFFIWCYFLPSDYFGP